jgi:hypothetical protein
MSLVTPTLNLPTFAASTKPVAAPVAPPAPAAVPAKAPDVPSATVTLSAQAQSALTAAAHAAPAPAPSAAPVATPPAAHDSSVYDMLKNGIAGAVTDVEDAISAAGHAVVDGVETTLSTANKVAQGIVELPFAAVAKVCDAAGAIIDAV